MKLSCSAYQAGSSSYAQKILNSGGSGHPQNYGAISSTNPTGDSSHGITMPTWNPRKALHSSPSGEQVKKMMSLWNRVDKWVGKTEMKHIRVKVVVFYVHLHFLRVRAAVAATRESLPETFAVSQFRGR
ncbi:hypothetical protein Fcan01_27090 [Folsomia candida]|uniref:Uncharacterized protein n=1 Tax=Folsomia candida TaxID=158441 RepID=A0A226CZ89_FOLCA|nr:hypothetical protein Fcan01_27090 [Folsomia candida]